ncbi:sensor histidine kinase [Aeromicrobium sp. UC242_57]|uniref:sensor histidine kinase n=1 Tax=Aeromicrobium sp. UC242_57 TaxID=3374624 RepID=UPI00378A41A9
MRASRWPRSATTIRRSGRETPSRTSKLQDELAQRSDDLRGIARAILPPALDHGRLVDALEVLAKTFGDTRLGVRIDAPQADGIDTRRQIAIYHIAAEAVFNAFRHSGARECVVCVLHESSGQVVLTVSDDGRGLSAQDQPGIGMTSMKERATELGGELTVSDSENGTTIKVVLP